PAAVPPAAARGYDRDPLRRRRRRGLESAATPQGGRRIGHPRPADREDRPVTATVPTQPLTIRRLDLAAVAAGEPTARRDHDALVRRGAAPDPRIRETVRRTLADVRARGDDAVRGANTQVGGGRPDGRLVLDPDDLSRA